jgi:S-adenosylmethionine:tRNA ribosyltransferase-isomerase
MSAVVALDLTTRTEAHEPPEARGLRRDEVRMLVAHRRDGRLEHARFRDLPDYLEGGDLLVINTSATLPAALPAERSDGEMVELHLSTPVPDVAPEDGPLHYVVELRRDRAPLGDAGAGEWLSLPADASAELLSPYLGGKRLWVAELHLPNPLIDYLSLHGRPISYPYVAGGRPLADYQTVYATLPGSAEMPSAGRPFTPELVTALVARGIAIAPITLHTGVSSLESGERPYPEWYRVPASTARLATVTRQWGGRVIAVGTTVVRALESAAEADGTVVGREGWTRLVITPEIGVRAVDGLITGLHDPDASHLDMLEAIGGADLIARSYRVASERGYLWHEFGDVNLILRDEAGPIDSIEAVRLQPRSSRDLS